MQDAGHEDRSLGLSFADYATWTCGGAFGGCFGLFLVAIFATPYAFDTVTFGTYLCSATAGMLCGWGPGFAARIATEHLRHTRWIGFCVAFVAGAFFNAIFAISFAGTASC